MNNLAIRVAGWRGAPIYARYNGGMHWIYLSPHFDDVALSCGGLVWEQVQVGDRVSIWTVCAGVPPVGDLSPFAQELHARWEARQNATARRKIEDLNSCRLLGASSRYFNLPDCIYRRHQQTGEFLYASEASLNGPLQPGDLQAITTLREQLKQFLHADMTLVCPLGLGNHVDHQLTRAALDGLEITSWYYADYPYVLNCKAQVEKMANEGLVSRVLPVSREGLVAWQDSVAAHHSQISTFWADENEMRQAVTDYRHWKSGIQLWRKPES